MNFGDPIESVPGIGPKRASSFWARGITRVIDLLFLLPGQYRVWPELTSTWPREGGGRQAIVGTVTKRRKGRLRSRTGGYLEVEVLAEVNEPDVVLKVRFYNQAWRFDEFPSGCRAVFCGVVSKDGKSLVAEHTAILEEGASPASALGRLEPLHPRVQGVAAGTLRRLLDAVLAKASSIPDPLPQAEREQFQLVSLGEALTEVHRPSTLASAERAIERLTFDRFLALFFSSAVPPFERTAATPITVTPHILERIHARFPFTFTSEQERSLGVILDDMAKPKPMSRLLQGDVGSGKTAVALAAALAVVAARGQVLFLAPTEPLAFQHAEKIREALEGSRVNVAYLSAEVSKSEKDEVVSGLESGTVDIAVGTHALLSKRVNFRSLRFVIIDEQHRFGVRQRLAARMKGEAPHLLVMSATPIPRSLCLALLRDLDHTQLLGRPAGRKTPETRISTRAEATSEVLLASERGERSYVVFPSIDGETMPGVERHGRLLIRDRGPWAGLKVAMAHGKLPLEQRTRAMEAFRSGEASVLLATSVIEVGLDVPEATRIIVFGAERFGLSSLHQLRGRVGRGSTPGVCLLVPTPKTSPELLVRLEVLVKETDGFVIAEEDLRLRGPGEILGFRQAGLAGLVPVRPGKDRDLFESAHAASKKLQGLRPLPEYYAALSEGKASQSFDPAEAG